MGLNSSVAGLNSSAHNRSLSGSSGDNSVIIRRLSNDDENENDTSIVNLNNSAMDDSMMSLGGESMAGASDTSRGNVARVATHTSDGGSMYSGNDVEIVGRADTT